VQQETHRKTIVCVQKVFVLAIRSVMCFCQKEDKYHESVLRENAHLSRNSFHGFFYFSFQRYAQFFSFFYRNTVPVVGEIRFFT